MEVRNTGKPRSWADGISISLKLTSFLDKIIYPIYYLDYETSSNAVPLWNHTAPYQQVPFQYSLHIKRDPNASLEHFDYLHIAKDNPIDGLLEKLSQDIDGLRLYNCLEQRL